MVVRNQTITTKASPDTLPKDIIISNIGDQSVTVSWQTVSETTAFITYGLNSPNEQTALDDRDSDVPSPRFTHHVTISNLIPQTEYSYKIVTGNNNSETNKFKTAPTLSDQSGSKPVIGSILDRDGQPLKDGIVYLTVSGAVTLSSPIKEYGNFLIPVNQIRTQELSSLFTPEEITFAKITAIGSKGQATALIKLASFDNPIGPLKLGEDVDLSNPNLSPSPEASSSAQPADTFDLNADNRVNSSDYAIILRNFGKSPKDKKADINRDGVVDQKDLDLISKEINKDSR